MAHLLDIQDLSVSFRTYRGVLEAVHQYRYMSMPEKSLAS